MALYSLQSQMSGGEISSKPLIHIMQRKSHRFADDFFALDEISFMLSVAIRSWPSVQFTQQTKLYSL